MTPPSRLYRKHTVPPAAGPGVAGGRRPDQNVRSPARALPGALKRGLGRGPDGPRRILKDVSGATSLSATSAEPRLSRRGKRAQARPPFKERYAGRAFPDWEHVRTRPSRKNSRQTKTGRRLGLRPVSAAKLAVEIRQLNVTYYLFATNTSRTPGVRRCRRRESNPQGRKPQDLSDLCVYQFRHAGT